MRGAIHMTEISGLHIKLSKILLNSDSSSSRFKAKVSGFDLSKLLPGDVQIAPRSKDPVTKESDVYTFGVLLLEVLCGVPELVDTDDYQERHVTEVVPKRVEQNNLRKIEGDDTSETISSYIAEDEYKVTEETIDDIDAQEESNKDVLMSANDRETTKEVIDELGSSDKSMNNRENKDGNQSTELATSSEPSNGDTTTNISDHTTDQEAQNSGFLKSGSRNFDYLHHEIHAEVIQLEDLRITFDVIKFELNSSRFKAKVSGFRFSRLLPGDVQIAPRSLDPAYEVKGELMKESDVYTFGVLLLEVLCGVPELVDTDDYQERHVTELVPKRLEQDMLHSFHRPVLNSEDGQEVAEITDTDDAKQEKDNQDDTESKEEITE
nr:tyrosine-protein kinase, non-receptor Jak2 [Tanacetum cinerariifolium]